MTSIIISGPPAVGKTTLARRLAERLRMRYVSGGDILKEMAGKAGFAVGGDDWWDTEEGMRFLERRDADPDFDRRVDAQLVEMCGTGMVVATSYTLPWLVRDATKLWLDGSHENSANRMKKRDNLTREEALRITKDRYDRNRTLYRRLYGFEFGRDDSVFDGVIETDGLDAEQVVERAMSIIGDR